MMAARAAASLRSKASGSKDGELLMARISLVAGIDNYGRAGAVGEAGSGRPEGGGVERGLDVLGRDVLRAAVGLDGGDAVGRDERQRCADLAGQRGLLGRFQAGRADAIADAISLAGALRQFLGGELAGIADDVGGGGAKRVHALGFEEQQEPGVGVGEVGGGAFLRVGDHADPDPLVERAGVVEGLVDLLAREAEGDQRGRDGRAILDDAAIQSDVANVLRDRQRCAVTIENRAAGRALNVALEGAPLGEVGVDGRRKPGDAPVRPGRGRG